jgi:geranylgeranyl diphosphate synthase type II
LSAASIELFHNAFLIHDDVEDGSEYRRGKPTLHSEHGVGIAVNVGDAMNVLSIKPLMFNLPILGPDLTWKVFSEIEHMARESVEGQAMELGWVSENDCNLTEEDYLRMTLKKTCWYTCIQPLRIGALIGSRGSMNLDVFNRFGFYMGAAFQIQDDLLNLTGDYRRYGKEIGGDLWEGKRTLMLIHLLNNCAWDEKVRLRDFLSKSRDEHSLEEVNWIYKLLVKYRSIEHGRSKARQLAGAALREFHVAFRNALSGDDKKFVHELIWYMIERDI